MDNALAETRWLAGDTYSLADLALVVYVRRLESFQLAPLWQDLSHLDAWYRAICARPAYERAIVRWGDVTGEKRIRHGREAFAAIEALWNVA